MAYFIFQKKEHPSTIFIGLKNSLKLCKMTFLRNRTAQKKWKENEEKQLGTSYALSFPQEGIKNLAQWKK